MWEQFKEHYWNWLGIFVFIILEAHLILIKFYGSVLIYENIQRVLWAELFLVPVVIVFGITRDIKDWRK